jgi:aminoglycoside phosphotransferase family enzyme
VSREGSASAGQERQRQRRVVEYLKRRESYPGDGPLEVVETHLSWVFLTDRHVYKLKKALRYPYLDYSTLAARLRNCREEARLDRRLAPDVCLGVIAVTENERGRLVLEGDGQPVEHLVKMRRLPSSQCLDNLLRTGGVSAADVEGVARMLSAYYAGNRRARLTGPQYVNASQRAVQQHARALADRRYGLDVELVQKLCQALSEMIREYRDAFAERAEAGRIIPAHGDLRPEHVYLTPAPVALDGLEFSRRLRTMDAADELAFLAMECDRRDAGWVGRRLLETYAAETGDNPPEPLVRFYKASRALLWAKLAVWHLLREPERDREKWLNRATHYLELARGYVM